MILPIDLNSKPIRIFLFFFPECHVPLILFCDIVKRVIGCIYRKKKCHFLGRKPSVIFLRIMISLIPESLVV